MRILLTNDDGVDAVGLLALRAGYVSVTPLSFAVELGDLSPGFQAFLTRLTQTFPLGHAGQP